MAGTDLSRLEQDLLRVPGVRSARVVGGDVPTEIHIVTTSKRSPKQVVRDVQSLAAAGYGVPIDHRIVSVVQLDEPPAPPAIPRDDAASADAASADATETPAPPAPERVTPESSRPSVPEPPAPPTAVPDEATRRGDGAPQEGAVGAVARSPIPVSSNGHRLVLERVVLATKGQSGWVKVALRWPDGEMTEGAGTTGAERDTRARGAATAVLQALAPGLDEVGAKVDVDHLMIQRVGSSDSVVVRALFYEGSNVTPLVGSAIVHDDVATAAARAILQAINRKLRLASQRA